MAATIAELATGYRNGSRDPVEATEECLAAIDELDEHLGAWQEVYDYEASSAARAAKDAIEAGEKTGPFFGIPFALKDIVDVAGRVTTAGSAEWANRVSPSTATIARRLLDAGGILLGKTKTVEFAMGGWGTNQHMGTPWNPWDPDVLRTPGGSSSGSGVAVASGMVPCAVGTDTGGSVRLPAALCGIVGLKTTEGLLPTDGIVPLSHTLDTPGPLVRTVHDAALMFDAMAGTPPGKHDWPASTGRHAAVQAALEHGLWGRRIGCLGEVERAGVEAAQLAGYDAALNVLAGLGAEIVPFELPTPFEEMKNTRFVIVTAESYHYYGELMENPESKVDERVRARVLAGASITASDYIAAKLQRRADQAEFSEAFRGFDAMVTPTTPMLPLPINEADETNTPALFTRAANFLALCATSVPTGVAPIMPATPGNPARRLPTSMQFMCRGGEETLSLALAAAYEAARGPLPNPPIWSES